VNVESAVREFLQKELHKEMSTVGSDDSLLETGTIDSVGVMQLVTFLERTYGITVSDDDLMPDNFDTLRAISAFVEARQPGQHD
jgi:acyl carrier protein